ncbi:serine protease [Bacteroidia bacterium]|nr:serine protease [Bacteroidia bacterium]GHT51221.1 serine protease [Bacteroidia bacterium]
MSEEKNKWLSVGNSELSTIENSIKKGSSSKGKPFGSLPLDENGIPFINTEQKVIIGDDDREKVKTLEYPYNCIALLRIEHNGRQDWATGFFISERCVATAGHCVFYNGQWAKSVTVIPGANLEGYPTRWGEAKATVLRSVKGWVRDGDAEYDYGAIILPDDTLHNRLRGTMGYAEYRPEHAKEVELSGYPYSIDKLQEQYHVKGKIDRVEANRLYYTIDTEAGQSGSPLFVREGDKCVVVGVHRGANKTETENHAISINEGVICRWQEWSKI